MSRRLDCDTIEAPPVAGRAGPSVRAIILYARRSDMADLAADLDYAADLGPCAQAADHVRGLISLYTEALALAEVLALDASRDGLDVSEHWTPCLELLALAAAAVAPPERVISGKSLWSVVATGLGRLEDGDHGLAAQVLALILREEGGYTWSQPAYVLAAAVLDLIRGTKRESAEHDLAAVVNAFAALGVDVTS